MNLDNDAIFVNDKASAGARLGLPKGALWAPKIWKKNDLGGACNGRLSQQSSQDPTKLHFESDFGRFCKHFGFIFSVCVLLLMHIVFS